MAKKPQYGLLIDYEYCTGCYACRVACCQEYGHEAGSSGMQVIEHVFPDHAPLDVSSLSFADEFEVLMTEKDAVKIGTKVSDRFWYVPVDLTMDPALAGPWLQQIESRMRARASAHE